MSETNTTLADIVAEMRRGTRLPGYWRSCALNKILQYHADRIEAAWNREREAIKSSAVGNAAAMREALVEARRVIKAMGGYWARETLPIIDAALSAPPRNCDLPLTVDGPANNNADKAWIVFKRHNPEAYFDVPGLLRCIDWLLATAAAKSSKL